MDYLDSLQHLDVPTVTTLVLVTAILAFAVYDPLAGRRQFGALVAGLDTAADAGERDVLRRRLYRGWTWHGWIAGSAAVLAVLYCPAWDPPSWDCGSPTWVSSCRTAPGRRSRDSWWAGSSASRSRRASSCSSSVGCPAGPSRRASCSTR